MSTFGGIIPFINDLIVILPVVAFFAGRWTAPKREGLKR